MQLVAEELQQYRGLRIEEIRGLGKKVLGRLRSAEQYLAAQGTDGGLPYYLALQHHEHGTSLSELGKILGLPYRDLVSVFKHYGIPRLTKAEAVRRNWEDPEFRARQAEAVRRNWEDPEFRARQAEAMRRAIHYKDVAEKWQALVKDISERTGMTQEDIEAFLRRYFEKQ